MCSESGSSGEITSISISTWLHYVLLEGDRILLTSGIRPST